MPQPNALRLVVWITLSSSLLGALFAYAENRPYSVANFVNTELHGVVAGGLNGGILSSLEILVLRGAYGARLRQLPFLPYLALRSLLYLGIILLVLIASNLRVGITRAAMSLGFNLLLGVNDLLGPGVLFAFVAGRYYHPRREERILLFIDMRASTAITAERTSARNAFWTSLNRFITDLSLRGPSPRPGAKSTNMSATRSSPPGRWRQASMRPPACAPVLRPSTASPHAVPPTSTILAVAPIFAPGFIAVRSLLGSLAILRRRSR